MQGIDEKKVAYNKISYTQEFFLCSLRKNGKAPVSLEFQTCLVVGSLMELLNQGYLVRSEKGKLVAAKDLDDSFSYLKPLYDLILSFKKPKDLKGVAEAFVLGSVKYMKELILAFNTSLIKIGYADELIKKGRFREKTYYLPKTEVVTNIVNKVRSEFLNGGTITEDTLCLAALLDKGLLIRNYFSKFEADALKNRLKEIRKSQEYTCVKEVLDHISGIIAAMIVCCC